jgi:hypothetical protein
MTVTVKNTGGFAPEGRARIFSQRNWRCPWSRRTQPKVRPQENPPIPWQGQRW